MKSLTGVYNSTPENRLLDEILLGYTDGHCLYDEDYRLLTWSENFGSLYPQFMHLLYPGLEYREILRYMVEYRAVKNFPAKSELESLDNWLDEQVHNITQQELQHRHVKYIHHFSDERTMLIQQIKLSNGQRFFAARDISESFKVRSDLKASAEKFSYFAQLASDWFWELDEELKYSYHSTHKRRLANSGSCDALEGLSRIEELLKTGIIHNDQLAEHNRCLLAHEPVDVILSSRKNEDREHFAHVKAVPRFNSDGSFAGYIGCGRDVTEIFGLQKQLSFYSSHDDLTGLLNRRTLMDFLASRISGIERAQDSSSEDYCVAQFDLDHFKIINDEAGHHAGDSILKQFSSMVKERLPSGSQLARLGGDEFVALIPAKAEDSLTGIQDLVRHISEYRFEFEGRFFRLGVSAGLVKPSSVEDSPSKILHHADVACYSAKLLGRNRVEIYSADNKFQVRQNEEVQNLKIAQEAISNKSFKLYLQPIAKAQGLDKVIKFEVLLRFLDDKGNIIAPGAVIPAAERFDLMQELDRLVLQKSLQWIDEFAQAGQPVCLSVNLSGATLGNQQHLQTITEVLHKAIENQGQLENLCIEITETSAIQNVEVLQEFIDTFHESGCSFALDDFGTGLASFKYLKNLPVDLLKIDGSFICNVLEDTASQAIVKSFNTLAHELGMQTVAEFVENEEISSYLEAHQIDFLQGYGIGVPEPIETWFERLACHSRKKAS